MNRRALLLAPLAVALAPTPAAATRRVRIEARSLLWAFREMNRLMPVAALDDDEQAYCEQLLESSDLFDIVREEELAADGTRGVLVFLRPSFRLLHCRTQLRRRVELLGLAVSA